MLLKYSKTSLEVNKKHTLKKKKIEKNFLVNQIPNLIIKDLLYPLSIQSLHFNPRYFYQI